MLTANALILKNVLSDGLLGRTYESIRSNINTEYKLCYGALEDDETKKDIYQEIKLLCSSFCNDINVKRLARDAISGTYLEGNYPMYLKMIKGNSAQIVHYPLNVCYPSDYIANGNPILEFGINDLKTKLNKTYKKNRKSKAIYFEKIGDEIKATYPSEVYKAYTSGDRYCRLNEKYTGMLTVNDMGRKFGVSPFFKCLKPLIIIQQIMNSDTAATTARQKVIIWQQLDSTLAGPAGDRKALAEQELAHRNAAEALKTNLCLYTSPWWVKNLSFVQAKATSEDSVNMLKVYNSRLLTSCGIGFADSEVSTLSVATISVAQILKTINAIAEDFCSIMHHFFEALLEDNGYERVYAPTMQLHFAEEMDLALRKDIATFAYSMLGASRETAMRYVGIDVNDERIRREHENEQSFDTIFAPHQTSYTSTGDSGGSDEPDAGGRPKTSDDVDQQAKDKERYQAKK